MQVVEKKNTKTIFPYKPLKKLIGKAEEILGLRNFQ